MKQDTHQRAKERYADAQDGMREQHARMLEDLRFSNPAEPEQWPGEARKARLNRPCLTFDRTNQFLQQVVNQARQNKPAIKFLPADSGADIIVAEKLNGMMRHIEYVSRMGIATDTAIDHAARVGLGWLRVVPKVMRSETNEQEIRIQRVYDPRSCLLCDWTEPDGSDATGAFAETILSQRQFEALYPKAKPVSMDGGRWGFADAVKLCEYFELVETEENRLLVEVDGQQIVLTEGEYWKTARATGVQLPFKGQTTVTKRTVKWYKMTGAEILEETDFPSQLLPIIPVIGDELWIDDKRYLCGMVRKMADSQRFHNYTVSQIAETVALQPKAPFLAPFEAISGFEHQWARANTGNDAYLPYNHVDEQGQPLPAPSRSAPPVMSSGWEGLMAYSTQALQASIGNFEANLGEKGNAVSGRAKLADQHRGDTANFHYVDNLSRSLEQLGRVVADMIPRVYDTKRQARILGEDGGQSFVQLDPNQPQAVQRNESGQVTSINPGVGAYDVRVSVGPSYTSMREEAAQNIVDLSQGNPQLGGALAPLLMKLRDMPDSDRAYKIALALLPPQVQKAYEDEDQQADIPPQVAARMEQMQQVLQQAGGEIQQLQAMLQQAQQEAQQGLQVKQFEAQARERLAQIQASYAAQLQAAKDDAAFDREELKAMKDLMGKQIVPPQALTADVDQDIASND